MKTTTSLVTLIGVAICGILFSCQSGASQNALEPKDFKVKMEQQPEAIVIDVRTPEEYSNGHLPEAINLDVKNPEFSNAIKELDPSKTYLLYCRSGTRTKKAAEIMSSSGFKMIHEMKGGFPDWEAAGFEVEK